MTGVLALVATIGLSDAAELHIPYEKYTLDNGLEVILAEDHDLPIVQTNIWYHVGSKDEEPGRSGFAHLFEHMMFQGSEHMDGEYFGPLQEVGARINGSTTYDRTNYFEGLPAEYLPLALWMEADRMGWLLPVLDEPKLRNQIDVVRNERRQRIDNQPYGTAYLTLMENLFPEGHPYHIPTIGLHEDLEAATLDDVRAFFETWYAPNNATLVVCGDFDPETARALIQDYFGAIPRGEEPPRLQPSQVTLDAPVTIRQTEAGVPHERVWIVWPTPWLYQPDDAPLDVLATTLSSGKGAPLYRELVLDRQIARSVSAHQSSMELSGYFMIAATAAAGHSTDELVEAIDEVLADVLGRGITQDDVDIAVTNYEASFLNGLRSISAKADRLNAYNHATGEPDFLQRDLDRYRAVTPEQVTAAGERWLGEERVVLHITPAPEGGEEGR